MKFKTFSRELIQTYIPDENCLIISVSDPDSEPITLNVNKFVKGVLRLSFHDIDNIPDDLLSTINEMGLVLFSRNHADKIIKFVKRNLSEISFIACNCEAGVSRSRGIAAALSKVLTGDDSKVFQRGRPNMRVRKLILERWHEMAEPV